MENSMCKMYRTYLSVFIILTILLSGCAKNNIDTTKKAEEKSTAQETESAPDAETETTDLAIDFTGTDIEGNTVTSAVFSQSKLTMVNVWATYCNPCLSEMPELGELAHEFEPEEFQIIGIISDVVEGSGQEQAEELIEQTQADYMHLMINESIYNALLTDVAAVPTTFFIDENGNILDTVIGAREKAAWEEKINEFLEK